MGNMNSQLLVTIITITKRVWRFGWQFSITTFHQSNQKVFHCKTDVTVYLVRFQVTAHGINKKWDCAKESQTGCSKAAVVHPN